MVAKSAPPVDAANAPEAEARLREAQARMKSAADRHAAIVSVLSRVGVSAQERRLAQAESKKVERDLRDAKRLLQEAQAGVRKQ